MIRLSKSDEPSLWGLMCVYAIIMVAILFVIMADGVLTILNNRITIVGVRASLLWVRLNGSNLRRM